MNIHSSDLPQSGPKRGESDFASIADAQDNTYGWGPSQLYPPNTEVFHQDAPANAVYLIERGLVKLSWVGSEGQEMILGLRRRPWLTGGPGGAAGEPLCLYRHDTDALRLALHLG